MEGNHRDWSFLSEDLLTVIGENFQSLDDILRFRSVCSSFRSSLSLPPKTLLPDSARRNSFPMDDDCLLTEATVYAIEPLIKISNTHETTQTWLVKVEESNVGQLQIKDPLTGFRFPNLCNVLPKSLNLLDYRVKEVTKAYKLELATNPEDKSTAEVTHIFRWGGSFAKTVACTSLDKFVVMVIYNGKLFVWRDGNDKLTKLDIAYNDFQDIICHDKKFYALRRSGHIVAFDSTSFNATQLVEPLRNPTIRWDNYLVNSLNDLLLVYQYSTPQRNHWNYGVCKLDEENREWVRVMNGLEDRVLFVSHFDCSFSVSAQEFSGCKGNCIYFGDYYLPLCSYNHPGFYARIFNLKDNTYSKLSSSPGYSKIFWPPPTWLKGHAWSAPPLHPPHE